MPGNDIIGDRGRSYSDGNHSTLHVNMMVFRAREWSTHALLSVIVYRSCSFLVESEWSQSRDINKIKHHMTAGETMH